MTEERKGAPLKCWPYLKEINNAYNAEINQAIADGKPVVFASADLPLQLIEGFDAVPIAGEWYGSICGHFGYTELLEAAEISGFSQDLCSYARITVGSMIENKSFLGNYPRPTVAIGIEGMCNVQAKWFEVLSRYHNVPFFVIDTPFIDINNYPNWGEDDLKYSVNYFVKQERNYIDFMEWALDQKLNEEKMIEACIFKYRTEAMWDEVMKLWRSVPSPVTMRNLFTFENLVVSIPCRKEAGDVLEVLIEELHQRMEKGITGMAEEKYRLVWNAQPGWYTLGIFKFFDSQGVAFVASPYLEIWGVEEKYSGSRALTPEWFREYREPNNLDDCLHLIARDTVARHASPRLKANIETVLRLTEESQADGVVWHAVRACMGVSYGQMAEKEEVRDKLAIPSLVFDGSPADPRHFSEVQVMSQIKIFMEQIKEHKRAGKG